MEQCVSECEKVDLNYAIMVSNMHCFCSMHLPNGSNQINTSLINASILSVYNVEQVVKTNIIKVSLKLIY